VDFRKPIRGIGGDGKEGQERKLEREMERGENDRKGHGEMEERERNWA